MKKLFYKKVRCMEFDYEYDSPRRITVLVLGIKHWLNRLLRTGIAIDLKSIENISSEGKRVSIEKITQIFRKEKILIYRGDKGNKPTVITQGLFARLFPVRIIDIDKLPEKEREKILNKIK